VADIANGDIGSTTPGHYGEDPTGLTLSEARMAAAFAAILALAVQTDVIGDPWVAYCVWALAGALLTRPQERLAAAPAAAIASV